MYAIIETGGKQYRVTDGDVIEYTLDMPVRFVQANPKVRQCCGRVAVQRGPVVYCAEGQNNDFSVMTFRLDTESQINEVYSDVYGTYTLVANGRIPVENTQLYSRTKEKMLPAKINLIPYFAFANNGESDMEVFLYY